MSNPNIMPVPLPDDDREDQATVDVDGEAVLDPDVDERLVDSASADRLASAEETESDAAADDESDVLGADVPAGGAGADSGAVDAVRVDPQDEASIPNRSPMNDEPGVGTRRSDQGGA